MNDHTDKGLTNRAQGKGQNSLSIVEDSGRAGGGDVGDSRHGAG